MKMNVLRENIDSHPYTGKREVHGYLKLSSASWLDEFFNGAEHVSQVTGVTRGKIYHVIAVEGYGDVEDVTFIDDNGEEQVLGSFFFEEVF